MEEIIAVDKVMGSIHEKLVEAAKRLEFKYICDLPNQNVVRSLKYKGVYKIDIKTDAGDELAKWIETFRNAWDLPELHRSFTCTTKNVRIRAHTRLQEWMPLYIGKSQNVGGRVLEHWHLPMEKPTFALKIGARPNMQTRNFRLSTIELPVLHYRYIAPVLESALRKKHNPIVGKDG